MMDIVVLGSAASSPTTERSLPAIAIRIDGDVILLDCGEGAQRQMMLHGISYSKIEAIFISHLHLDHYLGVFGLMETLRLNGRSKPVRLFGPPGSARVFCRSKLLDVVEIQPGQVDGKTPLFELNEHEICAFEADHGPGARAFGFVVLGKERLRFYEEKAHKAGLKGAMFSEITKKGSLKVGKKTVKLADVTYTQSGKKLAYSGDTIYCRSAVKASANADLLIHDSTFDESERQLAIERSHATAGDAARVAKEAQVKQLMLFHISGRYHEPSALLDEAKKVFPNTIVAFDGLKITL